MRRQDETRNRLSFFQWFALCAGFAFLYAPILLLMAYSFNASRLVTVWAGFSTRWYVSLASEPYWLAAASVSLRVAFVSAVLATVLGASAALALTRFNRFPGRLVFSSMIFAPIVAPEVIVGLSLLLMFVAADIPRGFWTIVIAHSTMGMCFVAVLVQARLKSLDPALEAAALDLGAPPLTTFARITLPLAAPSLIAGFMLAFTLSLDDFVLASFTSGPGSTTLPMRVYSQVRLGVTPQINAISTLMIAGVAALLGVGWLLSAHLARRARRGDAGVGRQ